MANLPLPPPAAANRLSPPFPSERVLRQATVAVGHFHAVLSYGARWWTDKRQHKIGTSMRYRTGSGSGAGAGAVSGGICDIGASAAGKVFKGSGGHAGRGSTVWGTARSIGGSTGRIEDVAAGTSIAVTGAASAAAALVNLDEYHSSPRLRFQLLLHEQGVMVTLFCAIEKASDEEVRPRVSFGSSYG